MGQRPLLLLLAVALLLPLGRTAAAERRPPLPELPLRLLEGTDTTLRDATRGHPTLLVLSFQRDQRADMESWMAVDEGACRNHHELRRVSVALLPSSIRLLRRIIDPAIRDSVGTERGCGRTATAYVQKAPVLRDLHVDSEEEVLVLLLDEAGTERWRGAGAATPEALEALAQALRVLP